MELDANCNSKWNIWYYVSNNATWEFIQNNSSKRWNWQYISMNPNITWEIIQDNPDKPWNWDAISINPNIDFGIVQNNPDKPWNYGNLSKHQMEKARNNYIRKELQQWFKQSELKAELMATVWHPKNYEKFKYLDPEIFGDDEDI